MSDPVLACIAQPIRRLVPVRTRVQRAVAASPLAPTNPQFPVMERAFAPTGGMVLADEIAHRLSSTCSQPISMLARWIVTRDAVSIVWQAQLLLPLFQFDLASMSLRPQVTGIARELAPVFDDWELCWWFAQPNASLRDRAPVDVFSAAPDAVLDAARAERFVALG